MSLFDGCPASRGKLGIRLSAQLRLRIKSCTENRAPAIKGVGEAGYPPVDGNLLERTDLDCGSNAMKR